jgi:hypothetical protein
MTELNGQHEAVNPEVGGGDPNTPATVLVGAVGAILVFVLIVAAQALFYNAQNETVSRINREDPRQLSRLRAEQIEALNSYGWQDQAAGVTRIPIDQAMAIIVQKTQGQGEP